MVQKSNNFVIEQKKKRTIGQITSRTSPNLFGNATHKKYLVNHTDIDCSFLTQFLETQ